jgi:hypothetical protein
MMAPRFTKRDAVTPVHEANAATGEVPCWDVHGDDTTVPVHAKGKTITGRAWVYVRDDRPFGGPDPPAAVFYYSRDRSAAHPEHHLSGYAGMSRDWCGKPVVSGRAR